MKKGTLYLTQTAIMLAILIVVQLITRGFGQFVTGSLVNFILLATVYLVGLGGGLTVALLSNFLAFFIGVGPGFIQVVPFVAVANAIFVLIGWLVRKPIMTPGVRDTPLTAAGLIAASVAKMAFLWVGLVLIALPLFSGFNEKQIAAITAAFTWPQLVTALIGSALAILLVPLLRRALARRGENG